jgi:hypothetical protein
MRKRFEFFLLVLALVLSLGVSALGQETTGNIRGTVKDPNGAVVPNATVTATNQQRSFTTTTDSQGEYEFNNQLPPDVYTVTASGSGFSEVKREKVQVLLGKTLQVNIDLNVAGTAASVNVTANEEPLVDVSSSKTATNVSQQQIDVLPKSLNFSSIINVAPGARNEPNAGGFQIDGASGSENRFIVDGLDVTRIFSGTLGSTKNIPYDFVQQLQVKSAGYEAEFGGATGGVINVATRSGSNDWHGEVRVDYTSSMLRAHDNPAARRKLTDLTQLEYFKNPRGKDNTRQLTPTLSLGGPILKNKLWFFTSYAPEFFVQHQVTDLISVVTGAPAETVLNSRKVTFNQKNDYFMGRLDWNAYSKLQVSATFINSPVKTNGQLIGLQTTSSTAFTDPRVDLKGGFTPSWQGALNTTWTPRNNIVVSARIGRNYLNDKGGNYDIPVGQVMPIISNACPTRFACVAGTTSAGNPTIQSNNITLFDITKRTNYNFDGTYIFRAGGQHALKGGYQRSQLFNSIRNERSGGYVNFYYDQSTAGSCPTPSSTCRGTYGYYITNVFGLEGKASSTNQGLFIQDSWQVHPRVTLNLGLRFEKEFLPAYPINLANHPSLTSASLASRGTKLVNFGWGDKVAPRLGGAIDVFGDGKVKIYGSYSVFYDVMKYDMARGSGGGEFWIQNYYTLEQLDFHGITPDNHPGTLIAGPVDLRLPSLGGGDPPGIDPNLKPMREHEFSFGSDYAFKRDTVFSARFTRKVLDKTIDDTGHLVSAGEEYTIANPGFGIAASFYKMPKAVRNYTGLELRVDKRFANNWYATGSYTYSRLYGNYGGLASSDEFGRANPNVNRYFDNIVLSYDNHGKLANGLLATDRPNTFKFFGSYRLNWLHRMSTDFGLSQIAYQGVPITTAILIKLAFTDAAGTHTTGSLGVFPNGRGDLGRTPWLTQSDVLINHRIKLNERMTLKFQFNVLNLWDQRTVLANFTGSQGTGGTMLTPGQFVNYTAPGVTDPSGLYINGNGNILTLAAAQGRTNDPRFNKAFQFQAPREARIAVGIEF